MLGMFYIVVLQTVLLYGLETWVISLCIGRTETSKGAELSSEIDYVI